MNGNQDELLDVVDATGQVIGAASRREVHGNPALMHPTVHLLVTNAAGHCYLQKRAWHKDIQPGKWDTSVGGHVSRGESPLDALHRESMEELGIAPDNARFCYHYVMTNDIESEFISTYEMEWNGAIHPNPDEILEGRFWSPESIATATGTGCFTPNFEHEWQRFKEYLNERRSH